MVIAALSVDTIKDNTTGIIRNQILRSALSIQSNIAGGSSKRSDREFARFLRIAMGSATESENHILLLRDLGLIDSGAFGNLNELLEEVEKMLTRFEKKLSDDANAGQ